MEEFEQNTGSGRRVTKVANEHGTGSSNEVWVILGHGPVVKKLPATERGVFHRGNCYLVIWCSERDPSKRKRAKYVMIYFASKQASERANERTNERAIIWLTSVRSLRVYVLDTLCTFGKACKVRPLAGGPRSSWASIRCCNNDSVYTT